ncbi:MAG TPA: hypothetical protein VG965_02760 [Patescibacteria group bacterium]|nr:hypothetical protein [Patescibacteria group bacterium]
MKSILDKLYFKEKSSSLLLHKPLDVTIEINNNPSGKYDFVLAFYENLENLEKEIKEVRSSLNDHAILWIAYPKAKQKDTNLNRDILREGLAKYSLEAVSIISIDDTWSALRFKQI